MLPPLAQQFHRYLEAVPTARTNSFPLAEATIKNYVSDVSIFLNWLSNRLQETTIAAAQLTQANFVEYGQYLNQPDNHLLPATAQRRLASLKRFGGWLKDSGRLPHNPAEKLDDQTINPTTDQLLSDFKTELVRQKLSPATIKNYLSDLKNYLNWVIENNKLTDNNIINL